MSTVRIYAYTCANYSVLAALTGVTPGDSGYTQDFGYNWKYDGVNSVWRIIHPFRCLAANLSTLVGMQVGDEAYATDTGAVYKYSAISGSAAWVQVSLNDN